MDLIVRVPNAALDIFFLAAGLIVLFFSLNASAQNQQLENSPARNSRGNIQTITANIPYQGYDESQAYFGQGEYQVFLESG